jgi:uncharacterized protein YdeI (YjbR/CyaY-like superfamily)
VTVDDLLLPDQEAWRDWLAANHGQTDSVWLVLAKKGTGRPTSLRYEQALEEALCFGWIDGQIRRRDDTTFRQRFSPRRKASTWSEANVANAERLIRAGRMQPAGLAEVERAKADGRWQAAYGPRVFATVPADLAAALAGEPRAQAGFDRLSRQHRYALLYRIHDAKRADTRARRIEQFVAMLAAGETPHPQKFPAS